ncbi:MAG: class I SAM-dependent methyltransferase [Defluviitaleaceae bacterium]|nr:class I SAM-dependent methyltransferase [Defluviitaleaceae bacterium]
MSRKLAVTPNEFYNPINYLCEIFQSGGININTIKSNLRKFYNADAAGRNDREQDDFKIAHREAFCNLISGEGKKTLLELGAGPGHDSKFFAERGLEVTAIDLSPEMVRLCKEKGIDAREADFYNLAELGKKFDCVWAMNSLLHVPKTDLREVLQGIFDVLNPGGFFYMGVWGGRDSEHIYTLGEVCETPRFFSFFTQEKLRDELQSVFNILSFEEIDNARDGTAFQSIVMRRFT